MSQDTPSTASTLARLRQASARLRQVGSAAVPKAQEPALASESVPPPAPSVAVQPPPSPTPVPVVPAIVTAPIIAPVMVEPVAAVISAPPISQPQEAPAAERLTPERLQAILLTPPSSPAPVIREEAEDKIDFQWLPIVLEEIDDLMPAIRDCIVAWQRGETDSVPDLHRMVHTLKGSLGMAGASRGRTLTHRMETVMEEAEAGVADAHAVTAVATMFDEVEQLIGELRQAKPSHEQSGEDATKTDAAPVKAASSQQATAAGRSVKVSIDWIDSMYREAREARLKNNGLGEVLIQARGLTQDLDENDRKLRDLAVKLDLYADDELKSMLYSWAGLDQGMPENIRSVLNTRQEQWQFLRGALQERINDNQSIRQSIQGALQTHESELDQQRRALVEVQDGLHKTRLTPVETWQERLQKVVLATSRELGKLARFRLRDNRVELDRALLEKVITSLEHILRNAVAHGLEDPATRRRTGKPEEGNIIVEVRQEAGRAFIEITDDGAGLNVERIRRKAVERNEWDADRSMDDKAAADMICRPGFSTADGVSEIAGRGVGMDVVRSSVLALGGRFDLTSTPGQGLKVSIQLPTDIASTAAMIVAAGGEQWVLPIEIIERVFLPDSATMAQARQARQMRAMAPDGVERNMSFIGLDALLGVSDPTLLVSERAPVLMLREGTRFALVEVDRLIQVTEVTLQPLGKMWEDIAGLIGSALLPNGQAAFLVDPLRAPWEEGAVRAQQELQRRESPVVLIVDDSVTVRVATTALLEKHGYMVVTASHGREALEVLGRTVPQVVLMDMEMPVMDGLECTRHIRQQPRYAALPVLMITTRTGDQHKRRAQEAGVTDLVGKPFKDAELLDWIRQHTHVPTT